MSVVRGRPPGFAGGISGTSRAYCSSLRACPAPKSPTKARLSAVHMTCLQQLGPLPNADLAPLCPRLPKPLRLLKPPRTEAGRDDHGRTLRVAAPETDARIITELELGQVAAQVLLAAMLVNALHAALEDAENSLQPYWYASRDHRSLRTRRRCG